MAHKQTMTLRQFFRGGYKTVSEPTVLTRHGVAAFTVFPFHQKYEEDVEDALALVEEGEQYGKVPAEFFKPLEQVYREAARVTIDRYRPALMKLAAESE